MIKVEKVAAITKLAYAEETPSVPFITGMRNELIPSTKPMVKNIKPIKANGAKVLDCLLVVIILLFIRL